jgi:hypothetical protein
MDPQMKFVFSIYKENFILLHEQGVQRTKTVTAGVQTLPWHNNAVRTSATGGHYLALIYPGLFFWRSTT